MTLAKYPAIAGVDDPAQARIALVHGQQSVQAAADKLGLPLADPALAASLVLIEYCRHEHFAQRWPGKSPAAR